MSVDEDESVRIAVRALGDMRNGRAASTSTSIQPTPALSVTSGLSSPSLPSPTLEHEQEILRSASDTDSMVDRRLVDDGFVSRVSGLPIVNTALRAYEQSKASSRVVKYGAEMVESSVKSISRPVIDRLPVNQLDDFACRQLDRIESYTRRTPSQDRDRERSRARSSSMEGSCKVDDDREANDSPMIAESSWPRLESQVRSRTPTPRAELKTQPSVGQQDHGIGTPTQNESQQVAQRSRWQAMLLEAGGISAAVSDESMRRLRYCLQWLQYATDHIDKQILVLRNFIASLEPSLSSPTSNSLIHISHQHLRVLNATKRDVVETLRQVVEVVSKYAGGALPEPARSRVRTFILRLPRRWAEASGVGAQNPAGGDGRHPGGVDRVDMWHAHATGAPYSYGPGEAGPSSRSRPASRATSPGKSRAHSRQTSANGFAAPNPPGPVPTVDSACQAAQRILTLATESLDMLRSVAAVVGESLDRADAWVERLRVVGLQRQQSGDIDVILPPPENGDLLDLREHRRSESRPDFHTHRQQPWQSPSSPLSPFAPLSPISGSAANSGHTTPYYTLSRNNSSSALSMLASSSFPAHGPDAGSATASLDALTLHSAASSRYGTPKSTAVALPVEGSTSPVTAPRGEKRSAQDGEDPTVVAATALAGLAGAGSAKRVKQDKQGKGKDEKMDVDADA